MSQTLALLLNLSLRLLQVTCTHPTWPVPKASTAAIALWSQTTGVVAVVGVGGDWGSGRAEQSLIQLPLKDPDITW